VLELVLGGRVSHESVPFYRARMRCDLGCRVGLAVVGSGIDGRAALLLVAGALKLPADSLLFVCGGMAARDDRGHRGGARRADGETLDSHSIQDHTVMAKVDDPERAITGGSAEFTARGLDDQAGRACEIKPLGAERAHHAIDLFRGFALNQRAKVGFEQRENNGPLPGRQSLNRCRSLVGFRKRPRTGFSGMRRGRLSG